MSQKHCSWIDYEIQQELYNNYVFNEVDINPMKQAKNLFDSIYMSMRFRMCAGVPKYITKLAEK